MPLPLVTCIMPTTDRRNYVRQAIELFVRQDYPRKQLVIVEDGVEDCSDVTFDALGNGVRLDYTHLGPFRKSIGEKRNIACERAEGDLIAHWDDDDWHAPRRLSVQVDAMLRARARLCGVDRLVFFDGRDAFLFQSVRHPWLAGGTFMYEKALWRELGGFLPQSSGEDIAFLDAASRRRVEIATLTDQSLYVAMIHNHNAEPKRRDSQWGGFDANTVRQWMRTC